MSWNFGNGKLDVSHAQKPQCWPAEPRLQEPTVEGPGKDVPMACGVDSSGKQNRENYLLFLSPLFNLIFNV